MRKLLFVILFVQIFAFVAFAQTAPQEKSVVVFGAKIRYLEAGDASKRKVILLHGLGASAESWQSTIPALAANYHVIAPDQIGFGKSDKPFLKYRIGTFADFLDKFMAELKVEKATLVGNSLGGWIAGFAAIQYPARVEKIVLVAAAGIIPATYNEADIYQLNNSTRDEIRANLKLIFAMPAFQNNEVLVDQFFTQRVAVNDGYTINAMIESIRRKEDFLNDRLGEIKKPTLIIWASKTACFPFQTQPFLTKASPVRNS
jgi:pimeloyl-ACP methyl ester carboxylesterase